MHSGSDPIPRARHIIFVSRKVPNVIIPSNTSGIIISKLSSVPTNALPNPTITSTMPRNSIATIGTAAAYAAVIKTPCIVPIIACAAASGANISPIIPKDIPI